MKSEKRYKLEVFIKSGVYGFAHVSTPNHKTDVYYYDTLKGAKIDALSILNTFKHVKGNCASIYDNEKMILTTNNDINYWIDYRKGLEFK